MTAQISVYGRLAARPESRVTRKDQPMATARMAVTLPCLNHAEGFETFWVSVVAFGKQSEQLLQNDKGEPVSVAGVLQMIQWTGNSGALQTGYQIVADSVVSARTVIPGAPPAAASGEQMHKRNNDG